MNGVRRVLQTLRGHRELNLDIVGRRRVWFTLSGVLIVLSLVGLFVRGLNFSIDFEGGAVFSYKTREDLTVQEVEGVLAEEGIEGGTVQIIGGDEVTVRVGRLDPDRQSTVVSALAEQAGIGAEEVSISNVSPTWGSQISRKALQGLVIFLILVTIYISFRFEWKMALSTLVALFHDLTITAGIYTLTGRQVTPETVIAILTILGYSIYDGVVIFDKVKENADNLGLVSREGYSRVANHSLNQVFMRSVNTSLTTLLPIGALLLFGGETLKDFAFALFIGILVGGYSSPFVATPLLALLKEREPKYTQIRTRLEGRSLRGARPVPARLETATVSATAAPAAATPAASAARPGGSPSRPRRTAPKRKPKRRRR